MITKSIINSYIKLFMEAKEPKQSEEPSEEPQPSEETQPEEEPQSEEPSEEPSDEYNSEEQYSSMGGAEEIQDPETKLKLRRYSVELQNLVSHFSELENKFSNLTDDDSVYEIIPKLNDAKDALKIVINNITDYVDSMDEIITNYITLYTTLESKLSK